jgi:tetratricopeptide (TPR) repeat protein
MTLAFYAFLAGCPQGSVLEGDDEAYVGSKVCAGCHIGEMKAWQGSHHDLAMQHVSKKTVLGDFSGKTLFYGGRKTRVFKRDGAFWFEAEGADSVVRQFRVAHTFGANPLQQYLVAGKNGRLQTIPWAWDARPAEKGGQKWFYVMADQEVEFRDRFHWSQPLATWNGMCADCHSTRLKRNFDPKTLTFATTYKSEDVSCEACHGPGSNHVASHRDVKPQSLVGDILSWLDRHEGGAFELNDGKTTATWSGSPRSTSEIDTCANCHSRRSPLTDGFKAEIPFMDQFTPSLIESGLYHPDGQIEDEVFVWGSFMQSKMHGENVTCSDCHDPHSLKPRFEGNQVCTQCHVPEQYDVPSHHHHKAGSDGARCTNCHMPETTYMGVDPRRDHSIRIPRPDMSVALGTPNACNSCHTDQQPQWAADAIEDWSGTPKDSYHSFMATHFAAAWQGDRSSLPGLKLLAKRKSLPGIVRASALLAMQGLVGPADAAALAEGLGDNDPLVRHGAIRGTNTLPLPIRQRLLLPRLGDERKANRVAAAQALYDIPAIGLSAQQREMLDNARTELLESHALNLWRGEGGLNMGQLAERRGDIRQAEVDYRKAINVDPYFEPPRIMLANLYRAQGNAPAERKALQEGLDAIPNGPSLNHAWGLHLVRGRKYGEALAYLEKAARLAPQDSRFGYVYGTALHSLGQHEAARKAYAAALDAAPNDVDTLYALALLEKQLGNHSDAIHYAKRLQRQLPNEPAVHQLLNSLAQGN